MLIALRRGAVALLAFTVLVGVAYPLLLFGIGQVAFGDRADGSLVRRHGRGVGSSLIGRAVGARRPWGLPPRARPRGRWPAPSRSGSVSCSGPTPARRPPTSRPSWSPP